MATQEEFDQHTAEVRATPEYRSTYWAIMLGEKVREAREGLGWTQDELAGRSGMKQNAISRFENGGGVPSLATLDRLARALGGRLSIEIVLEEPRD